MRIIGAYNTTGDQAAPSLQEHVFVQEFISPLSNLHKVEVMFAVAAQQHDQILLVKIIDTDTGEVVRQVSQVAAVGARDSFIEFEFEPIQDSKGKQYELVIGPEIFYPEQNGEGGATDLPPILIDQPVQLKFTTDNYYQRGELYIDGEASGGDLVFRSFHQIDTSYSDFVLSSITSKIQADPVFFALWLVLIITALTGVVTGLVMAVRVTKK
jgi:hypothetical protein